MQKGLRVQKNISSLDLLLISEKFYGSKKDLFTYIVVIFIALNLGVLTYLLLKRFYLL